MNETGKLIGWLIAGLLVATMAVVVGMLLLGVGVAHADTGLQQRHSHGHGHGCLAELRQCGKW